MYVILTGSNNLEDAVFTEKFLVDGIAKIQYDNEIPLSEIKALIPRNPAGATYHLSRLAKKYGITTKEYSPKWNATDDYPQKIVDGGFYGKYNAYAAHNNNTRLVEMVRKTGGGYLLNFITTKKDTDDIVRKAKAAGNIEIMEFSYRNYKSETIQA